MSNSAAPGTSSTAAARPRNGSKGSNRQVPGQAWSTSHSGTASPACSTRNTYKGCAHS
ncbi:hypothetical protein ACN20G_32275 (plasmid) [Streptomyces sp. BI20]|uniref:hypothetical protein n=1 Tax=Streptomyces sp. BI20 TaxID=3403460 RepID=UPI003C781D53